MIRQLILILGLVSLFSCTPNYEEKVKTKYELADSLFHIKRFNDAKLVIDTIVEFYPDYVEYVTRGKDLLRSIRVQEQEENLVYLDSMLTIKEGELALLMKNFRESEEYGAKTLLIHKRQRPENSFNRSYISAHLNTEGEFFISSRYVGEEHIYHKQIKVYDKESKILSEEIEKDDFQNRHFDDGEFKWEVVQYKDGKDNGVVDFIASNVDKPLKVEFIGKKHHYILMEKFDKEAIRDAYEISFVLKEVKYLKDEKSKVSKELKRLKPKKDLITQ